MVGIIKHFKNIISLINVQEFRQRVISTAILSFCVLLRCSGGGYSTSSGSNISSIDEFQNFNDLDLGFDTFEDDYTNLTDLYIDANTDDLYFASVDDPDNKLELIDFDGLNFGINTLDGFTPIAVEVVTDSSLSSEYFGNHILLSYDQYYNEFVGFIFDENGIYIDDLGSPNSHQAVNDAENLFGFDFNYDGVQGRNVQLFDRDDYLERNNISKLEGISNTCDLYTDVNSGELLFAHASEPSNQQSLYNRDGYNYLPQNGQTAIDIEQDSDGNLQLLSYREAGTITRYFTEMVKKKVKKVKRNLK